jgi:hypothetical protein
MPAYKLICKVPEMVYGSKIFKEGETVIERIVVTNDEIKVFTDHSPELEAKKLTVKEESNFVKTANAESENKIKEEKSKQESEKIQAPDETEKSE